MRSSRKVLGKTMRCEPRGISTFQRLDKEPLNWKRVAGEGDHEGNGIPEANGRVSRGIKAEHLKDYWI